MSTIPAIKLVRTPNTCGGSLRIDGTRMTVAQIVWLYKQGMSAEEIVEEYPQRTLSEIHGVLAWYFDHQESFDAEMAAEAEEEERIIAEFKRDNPQ